MSDWFKKISTLITSTQDSVATPLDSNKPLNQTLFSKLDKLPDTVFKGLKGTTRSDPTFASRDVPKHAITNKAQQIPVHAQTTLSETKDKGTAVTTSKEDDNIKALKHLRSLPRGTQVDSRIAAIKSLLGDGEIFKTLKMLRWPQGVICPRCHSSNVVRRDPPADAVDQRHFYVCLNCKGDGSPSDFDDFTGLPIGEMRALKQWILCWYLIGFCSVAQIAKVLGISVHEVMQIAQLGNELTQLPQDKATLQARQELEERKLKDSKKQRERVDQQEDYTRSASKAPLKPGYKSKK
ncbi:MAG: transposase [Candidatus Berkiella sp.]